TLSLYLLSLILLSCGSKDENRTNRDTNSASNSTDSTANQTPILSKSITVDTTEMIAFLNEFVPTITKLHHPFVVRMDWPDSLTLLGIDTEYLQKNEIDLLSYAFDCRGYFKSLRVTEIKCADSSRLANLFTKLYKSEGANSGCLTKARPMII
ncbi:MAG: hypothetical protein ACI837_002788, partial [Crocinitomicaceae bacterium]